MRQQLIQFDVASASFRKAEDALCKFEKGHSGLSALFPSQIRKGTFWIVTFIPFGNV